MPGPRPCAPSRAAGAWRLSRPAAFTTITAIFVLFAAAASAPSPLYVVYQQEWGFSSTTLTVVFAVYVLALIVSLLVLGALSDHVGRRPVLAAAITLEAVALCGIHRGRRCPGADSGPGRAGHRHRRRADNARGHAGGPEPAARAGPGRGGQRRSADRRAGAGRTRLRRARAVRARAHALVYALLLGGMGLAAVAVAGMPETSARRPGGLASLAPRLGVPARLRPDVLALVPILVASWALGGLYLSLGPSVAASLFGLSSHLIGGLVVTLLCGTGAVTAFALRAWRADRILKSAARCWRPGWRSRWPGSRRRA